MANSVGLDLHVAGMMRVMILVLRHHVVSMYHLSLGANRRVLHGDGAVHLVLGVVCGVGIDRRTRGIVVWNHAIHVRVVLLARVVLVRLLLLLVLLGLVLDLLGIVRVVVARGLGVRVVARVVLFLVDVGHVSVRVRALVLRLVHLVLGLVLGLVLHLMLRLMLSLDLMLRLGLVLLDLVRLLLVLGVVLLDITHCRSLVLVAVRLGLIRHIVMNRLDQVSMR